MYPVRAVPMVLGLALLGGVSVSCGGGVLDAGSDRPRGLLPVDARNPLVISNDGALDNWHGELAVALAAVGTLKLRGIVVNFSTYHGSLGGNLQSWREMVAAARASGMTGIPEPVASDNVSLLRPSDGDIDATMPNRSAGAQLIVDESRRLALPYRPLVVATGGPLTDLADAYLIDHTVVDRVVVVSSLGSTTSDGASAVMGYPNGEVDTWANEIVARRFRYVQVNAYYAQQNDITVEEAATLPDNAFGDWVRGKVSRIFEFPESADQISVAATAFPAFALEVKRMSEAGTLPPAPGEVPTLQLDPNGSAWVVGRGDAASSATRLLQVLSDPATYRP